MCVVTFAKYRIERYFYVQMGTKLMHSKLNHAIIPRVDELLFMQS